MTLQTYQQTVAIHIFPYISQRNGKQTMKFGQVIEYKEKNTFLPKLCRK